MKKISLLLIMLMVAAAVFTSCAPSRGRGCPTTNPNYFRQW